MSLRLALSGLIIVVGAAPALGATRARLPSIKTPAIVNLENKRPVSLLSFEIVMPAKDRTPETVVGKLDKPLAAGKSVRFPLSGAKGCMFEARWKFEDSNDSGAVDLCNDAHIVLVD